MYLNHHSTQVFHSGSQIKCFKSIKNKTKQNNKTKTKTKNKPKQQKQKQNKTNPSRSTHRFKGIQHLLPKLSMFCVLSQNNHQLFEK